MALFGNRVIQKLIVIGCIATFNGCGALIGQKWSDNYTSQTGTRSTTPAVIDGDLSTAIPLLLNIHPEKTYTYPPAEIEITLPEARDLRRIVVHSGDLKDFQLWAYDADKEEWRLIREVKGGGKSKIEVLTHVRTDRIKLKVNTVAILGGRNVLEQAFRGSSEFAEGETLVERLRSVIGKAELLDQLNQIEAKLPRVREIELYGYE